MNDKLNLLLSLIKRNASLSEISSVLNTDYKTIYYYLHLLKENGYEIIKKYYYNGNTSYQISNQLFDDYTPVILTDEDDRILELLVYSDLHFGSYFENSKYLRMLYDYSKKKNIHVHLNVGDLVEGDIVYYNTKIPVQKQIYHALEMYPHSEDILVFLLLGNHDYNLLEGYGINIAEIIKNRRGDIIPIGYKEGIIKIKNDSIVLQHPILNMDIGAKGIYNHVLIIRGHGHEAKITVDTSNVILYTPSLSDLNLKNSTHPGFMHLTLKMHYGLIENLDIKELIILNNKINVVNDVTIFVGRGKKLRKNNIIMNEEVNPKILRREV